MFLLCVFGVFIISLFGSQGQPQTRDQVFECYSWGDPHIQLWHAKSGGQIQNRDCFSQGVHTLLSNRFVDFKVRVNNRLVIEADLKFHDGSTTDVLCHIHLKNFNKTTGEHRCERNGIAVVATLLGAHMSFNINYPTANLLIAIRENGNCPGSCYYNIYLWQPYALVVQSTGICGQNDLGCDIRTAQADESDWEPVRSGSSRQFITNEHAETICNQYIDAFFMTTHQAPSQRSEIWDETVASVLAGCVSDLVLTGQIEMAQGSLDVLMMKELTREATSIAAINTAIQSGMQAASFSLNNAVRMAEAAAR